MKRSARDQQQQVSKGRDVITVRGVVVPSEWDADDEVTAVTIYAHDEAEYVVNAKYVVKRLLEHVDEEVEAMGFMSDDGYGEQAFIVSDFVPLEGADEDEALEDDEEEWDDDEDEDEEEWDDDSDDEKEWDDDDDDDGEPKWKRYRYR